MVNIFAKPDLSTGLVSAPSRTGKRASLPSVIYHGRYPNHLLLAAGNDSNWFLSTCNVPDKHHFTASIDNNHQTKPEYHTDSKMTRSKTCHVWEMYEHH